MVGSLPRGHTREIVTVKNDITYPLYGGFISGTGSRLRYKDKTLEQKGGAETYEIYQDLMRDPHVYAVMQKRYMAVVGREWYVEAGGDRRIDQKAADMVKAQLQALSTRVLTEHSKQTIVSGAGGFDTTCLGLLGAILIGFSVGEILWRKESNEIYPQEIRIKDQRRFAFYADEKSSSFALKLLTPQNQWAGQALPNRKFITHVFYGQRDNPYGLGLGGKLYWPVFFKKHNIKFWLAFCDKYGSPTAVGTYQQGNKAQRDELLKAIRAIAQEAGVAIPEGTTIDFVEANRSGATAAYKDLAEYMDHEISKAVLGETGTTDQSGDGGSRARDEVANNIRVEIAKFDSDLLSDTLNRTLIKWIVDYNFGPGTAAYPKVWRRFPELEEKEDLNSRVNRDKTLQELGWRMSPSKVEEIYGDGYESAVNEEEGKDPPLVSTLGVGGVQALTGFLSQVSQGDLPRKNAIATLTAIFGVSQENAELMIPEQSKESEPEGEDVQSQLDSIFSVETEQEEDIAPELAEGKYSDIDFVPPKGVRDTAARGLELRKKHGRGGLSNKEASGQSIGSGVQRATNLKNGDRVSPQTIKRMVSFFARHEKNKGSKKDDGTPGAGKIAWLLWGGDAGQRWANKVAKQMDSVDMAEQREKQDIASLYTTQAVKDAQQSIDGWLTTIQSVIDEIAEGEGDDRSKFIALQERLNELYSELPLEDYAAVLGEAIAAADSAGRFEVVEELPAKDIEFKEAPKINNHPALRRTKGFGIPPKTRRKGRR